jgi:hypothetical protein
MAKKHTALKWGIAIGLICLVAWGIWYGVTSQSILNPIVPTTVKPTAWTFNPTNTTGDALSDDEVALYVYGYDASDIEAWDDDKWNALGYSDLVLEDTLYYGDTFTPQADNFYWGIMNGTGYNTQTLYLTAEPLGVIKNTVMLPTPNFCNITGRSTGGSVSLNQTTDNVWYISVTMTDADYAIDNHYGYRTCIDYTAVTAMEDELDAQTFNVIEFETNLTTGILSSDIKVIGHPEADVYISADKVGFAFTADFVGETTIQFEFSENIGSTFEVEAVVFGTGPSGTLTEIDDFY